LREEGETTCFIGDCRINFSGCLELHALLLARLRAAGEIEWSRAIIDSSHVQAKKGAPKRAREGALTVLALADSKARAE